MMIKKEYVNLLIIAVCILFAQTLFSQVRINEVAPMNYSTYSNQDASRSDWIELKNTTQNDINLSGWKINDKKDWETAFILPDTTIAANSFMLLLCDDNEPLKNPYKISADGEGIYKWEKKKGYSYKYKKMSGDFSMSFTLENWNGDMSGTNKVGIMLSESLEENSPYCFLNVARNNGLQYIAAQYDNKDSAKTYEWWLASEEYLTEYAMKMEKIGDSLHFYYRVDGYTWRKKHSIKNFYGNDFYIGIAATSSNYYKRTDFDISELMFNNKYANLNDYQQIDFHCRNKGVFKPYREIFTGFGLNNSGETLYLFDNKNKLVDSLNYPELYTDVSYGYDESDKLAYFQIPTPSAENENPLNGIVDMPILDIDNYWFNDITAVKFKKIDADIYYTTNGNTPDENAVHYNGDAIVIDKVTPIRAVAYKDGFLHSDICNQTIFVGEQKPNLDYFALIVDSLDYFNDVEGEGLAGGHNWFHKYLQKPGFIEYFSTDNQKLYSSGVDLKIHGRYSRSFPQKSHRITARSSLGNSKFRYPFFGENYLDKFDKLIIRNAGNDIWETSCNDMVTSIFAKNLGLLHSTGKPVTMFLNGQYWGKFNLREKLDDEHIAEIYNINEKSINYIDMWEAKQGTSAHFDSSIVKLETITDKNSAEFIKTFNDYYVMKNFADYFILNTYINNNDWLENNVLLWSSPEYDNKMRFVVWDTDFSYLYPWDKMIDRVEEKVDYKYTRLLRQAFKNEELRNYLLNRAADLLNTEFLPEKVIAGFDSTIALFEAEIPRHQSRWEKVSGDWEEKLQDRHKYAGQRPEEMRENWQEFFKLGYIKKITLNSNVPNARITINTISTPTIPWSGMYFSDVPIVIEAPQIDGYIFTNWEGASSSSEKRITVYLNDKDITIKAIYSSTTIEKNPIVINEIMYKCAADKDAGDWIEIYNTGDKDVDISNWYLKDDNDEHVFKFPSQLTLQEDSYLAICRDKDAFKSVNSSIQNVISAFDFGFGSKDMVRLYDKDMNLIDKVEYTSKSPWYKECDGEGSSLECINPKKDNSVASNWQPSGNTKGTPGKKNNSYSSIATQLLTTTKISMNTVTNTLNIELPSNMHDNCNINVIDNNGRIVANIFSGFLQSNTLQYNTSMLTTGIYFVQIESNHLNENLKFSVVK